MLQVPRLSPHDRRDTKNENPLTVRNPEIRTRISALRGKLLTAGWLPKCTIPQVQQLPRKLRSEVALRPLELLCGHWTCFQTIQSALRLLDVRGFACTGVETIQLALRIQRMLLTAGTSYTGGQTIRREVVTWGCVLDLQPCKLLCKYNAANLASTGITTVHRGQGSY